MRTVDRLISKFIEAKEELRKESTAPYLDTKDGLETMEKNDKATDTASPTVEKNEELSKVYIPQAYKYPPTKPAAPKPTAPAPTTSAPKPEPVKKDEDDVKKGGFPDKTMQAHALSDAFRASQIGKKPMATSHPATLPSPEEHAARASSFDDFMPAGKFSAPAVKKTVNGSYSGAPNSLMQSERISLAKNGQWSLEKAARDESGNPIDKAEDEC